MSKPRYRWWGFACRMIRDYPWLKADYAELHKQSMSAGDGMPRGRNTGRMVESTAMRQMPVDDQNCYDAVARAIELTRVRSGGAERLELIRQVYWQKKRRSIRDAARTVGISEQTAKRWHGDFVRLVGSCYGFETRKTEHE